MFELKKKLGEINHHFSGEIHTDELMCTLYATDASAYRELPVAVAIPDSIDDIKTLVKFASENHTSLIPRTAGTSLAGQVVGKGIVVDVSRRFTRILEVNTDEMWVKVQPGVIRDELNHFLKDYDLFFGPETSTANRAMIGGMVGNNSCGSNSVVYGSTRDHLISVKAILSDGNEVEFKTLDKQAFNAKCLGENVSGELERSIYQSIQTMLSNGEVQQSIIEEFPKSSINRRNTGYAIDLLMQTEPFQEGGEPFNFCKLLAGSEGTLAFITEIKLHVDPMPPKHKGLLCLHCNSIDESLRANLVALKYAPYACELMDHYILECTKENLEHSQNRFFVKGDPKALLVIELAGESEDQVQKKADQLIENLKNENLGYHFPLIKGEDMSRVWNLRKAGLGLLSNIPGDAKPVPVIEDTAVDVNDLPAYIRDFNEILKKYDLYSVHYAHAGSGELHLRPIINLKTSEGNRLFKVIADEIAHLVKRYKGSLSGEHGDGRLRGEFIAFMIGEKNYQLLEQIKRTWDPQDIFNSGKIVNSPPMNQHLRYQPEQEDKQFDTIFNFRKSEGILRAAEQCNGSGDCRKTELAGGTMCPSYMATKNEKDTTRARANILRETLTNNNAANAFDAKEILEVMDLCLSCKGCKKECPSNVDVAKLKAEASYQYYKTNGVPFRTRIMGNFNRLYELGAIFPGLFNFMITNHFLSGIIKSTMGFAKDRSLPTLGKTTLRKWYKRNKESEFITAPKKDKGKVYLFCDEFTNLVDTTLGIKAVELLTRLGYEVVIPSHSESGRTYLSKGLLKQAKQLAEKNIIMLKDKISEHTPLLGIEPSSILTFRDEYPEIVSEHLVEESQQVAKHTFLIEEFISKEIDKGNINRKIFTNEKKLIKLHGHCHQKALSSLVHSKKMLTLPENYSVHLIRSGCCGMAGSFGYEKKHYQLSMKVGELVLLPEVRKQNDETIIAASGTSCRHQILDGTGKQAKHPIEILYEAII